LIPAGPTGPAGPKFDLPALPQGGGYDGTDVPVFAVRLLPSGQWEMVGPVCRELAYRYGLRRIALLVPFDLPDPGNSPAGSSEGLVVDSKLPGVTGPGPRHTCNTMLIA
jgi:hypothetical protein